MLKPYPVLKILALKKMGKKQRIKGLDAGREGKWVKEIRVKGVGKRKERARERRDRDRERGCVQASKGMVKVR